MKALKIIGIIFVVFVVAICGLTYWGISQFDNLIKTAIEEGGTEITGAQVSIANIDTSFRELRGEVTGLVIGNPPGFDTESAFSLNKVAVQMNRERMSENLIVIKEILIDGAKVTYEEQNFTGSNLKAISDHVQQKMEEGGNQQRNQDHGNYSGQQPRFIVESFTFSNAEVNLVSRDYGSKALTVPSINETDIGGTEGITGEELGAYLLDTVYTRTKQLAQNEIQNRVKGEVRGRAQEEVEKRLSDEDKDKLRNLMNR